MKKKTEYKIVTSDGEILYDYPVQIDNRRALDIFGATWNDCVTVPHMGVVYFYKTADKALVDYQWRCLNAEHARKRRANRCMVPGKSGKFVRCPDKCKCEVCPFADSRKPYVLSIEGFEEENGWEPPCDIDVPEQVTSKVAIEDLKTRMDAKDKRLFDFFLQNKLMNKKKKDIGKELNISPSRMTQLVQMIDEILEQFREDYR